MTDSEKKIFEAFATKALKLSAEELASLYNDAGELTDISILERKDTERIQKLSTDKSNQYNRGLKEGASKLEKELKEKYEVETDLIGVELFDHVLNTKLEEVKSADPKEVMKHPEVIKALSQKDKEKKQAEKDWQKKLDDQIAAGKKNELLGDVKKNAFAIFDNEKYILPEDARKAQRLKDVFASEITKGNFQKDGDSYIVLKEDGTPLQDDHGNNVTFDDFIKTTADQFFDKETAQSRSNSGNKNQGQGGGSKTKIIIKDRDDYVSKMRTAKTPQERIEIQDAFDVLTKK